MEEGLNSLVSQGQVHPLHSPKADNRVILKRWVDVEEVIIEEANILWKLILDFEVFRHYLQEFLAPQVFVLDQPLCLFLEVKRELEQGLLNLLIFAYGFVSFVIADDSVYSYLALQQQLAVDIQSYYLLGEQPHGDLDGCAGIARPEVKHSPVDDEILRKDMHPWITQSRFVVFVFEVAKKMHAFVLFRRDIQPKVFGHVVPSIVPLLHPHPREGLLGNLRLFLYHLIKYNKREYMTSQPHLKMIINTDPLFMIVCGAIKLIAMLSLAEIIIERIKDAHEVRRARKAEAEGEESSPDGKRVQIMVAQIERRENYRLKQEIACLQSLETLSLSSEESFKEFMTVSMAIFRTHCPSFQQTTSLNIAELPNMKVHRLYREFLLKYANTFHFAHICSYLRREICELNAVIYLGWLGQWSRGLLSDAIKKWGSSSESLRLRTELSKLVRDRLGEEKSKESTQLFLHSRQNFYSYFLAELEQHYRKLDILDLDLNYLRSIKRVGRKEELIGRNVNESIAFIISKNNVRSAEQIRKYGEEYDDYCQRRSRKKMRVSFDPQRNNKIPRMVMVKTLTSNKKIVRQENIENNDFLRGVKKSKKSKILLGEACQRIQFPLIQTVVNSKCVLSSPKTKKSLRRFIKTQAEEQKQTVFVIKNQIKVRSFFKRPPISSITPQQSSSQKVIFEFNSIQSQFQSRRQSIIKKIQQRGIDLTTKGSKVTLPASSCFDDHALIRLKEERMFLSEKSK